MAKCDIVIPFYQTESGILSLALRAILNQTFDDYRVLIIDDGSPSPVELDLAGFSHAEQARFHVIKKPNGGVSSARNAGLEAVSSNAAFVCFLDSDDVWTPDHLARINAAMAFGGPTLFWDAMTPDKAFGSLRPPSQMIDSHNRIAEPDMDQVFHVANVHRVLCGQWFRHMHLSCTAISSDIARSVKFREEIEICEDFDFFLQCADRAERTIVCDLPGVVRGAGANLWHGVDFFDPRTAQEKLIMTKLLKAFRRSPRLNEKDRKTLDLRIRDSREHFYWIQRSEMKNGRRPSAAQLGAWFLKDPSLLMLAAGLALKLNHNGGRTIIPGDDL